MPFSRFIFLRGPPMWIDNGLKDFKLTPVATMAGLLLHAMAGKPAGGICISHFAAASLRRRAGPDGPRHAVCVLLGALRRVDLRFRLVCC